MKISEIITPVNTMCGAPMGRLNIGSEPITVTSGKSCKIYKSKQLKVYQKKVQLIDGYDCGGVYWGYPNNLYVRFTKDLKFVSFFRS